MKINYQRMIQAVSLLVISCAFLWGCSFLNDYQDSGELKLAGLKAPVKVMRDEKGMAYIYARNRDDAMMAYGFVTAQDRLFQMEVTRRFAQGRICELAGERARALDIRMRTIGFFRNAKQQAAILAPESRRLLQRYVDGVNAYIETRKDTHHLEFKLAGIAPTKWTIQDSLSLAYLLSWNSAANLKTEIIAQMLVDAIGPEQAKKLFPLNINPDDPSENIQNGYAGLGPAGKGLSLRWPPENRQQQLGGFFPVFTRRQTHISQRPPSGCPNPARPVVPLCSDNT
jgi:penicillin amidase